MTNKKVAELDAEFIEYKAKAKASMDALEKKIDDGIRKLDVSIKAMKEESDAMLNAKFEELMQLILGTAPSQSTHVDHVPQITKVPAKTAPYVPPILRTYDDLGFPLPKFQNDLSTAIGKNQRSDFIELEDSSSKPVQGKLDHMNDDRNRQRTSFGSEFEATGFEQPTGFRQPTTGFVQPTGFGQPTTRVKRETHNKYEHRMRKLKMPLFDGEDAYGWIYRVERYFEIQELPLQEQLRAAALCMEDEALSWRLLIRFQQSQEGNPYEQFLAITQEESARAYVALFEKLACQLVGIPESVMEATFIKRLKPALRATVRVMNPEGLNQAMKLVVSIEDNELYEGVMQSKDVAAIVEQTTSKGDNFRRMIESEIKDRRAKGLCFRCEEKYTPGHRCASSTLQVLSVDESDEAEERDLNFKSWNRGSKTD
ncbi:hypothetical protein Tco_0617162 [Tanacetum coccineum]